MDIAAIKPANVDVHIQHPGTGADTGLIIKLASRQSEAVKKVSRRHTDKMLSNRGRKTTVEELETRQIELLAAAVVGWEWVGAASWGGKKLEFTPENVATVLSVDWLRRQIEEEAANEADFFTS